MSTSFDCEFAEPTSTSFLSAHQNPLNLNRVSNIGFRFAQHDWPWQLAQLRSLKFRAAIVGRQGSGKTTLLNELADQFNRANIANQHVFLPQESTCHRKMIREAMACSHQGAILLVDGMERLSFLQRWGLLKQTKRGSGLVVAVHHACSLPTWVHCQTNPELMRSVLADLGLDDPSVQDAGQRAFENSDGNVREALCELYDQFSSGRFNNILSR